MREPCSTRLSIGHGQDMAIQGVMRADAMLDRADLDGYAVWRRILQALEDSQRAGPGADIAVH